MANKGKLGQAQKRSVVVVKLVSCMMSQSETISLRSVGTKESQRRGGLMVSALVCINHQSSVD